MQSSSHTLGLRRQVSSAWTDWGQRQSLVSSRRLAEENPESHVDTVTRGRARSQTADAARKIRQLEASVQEVAKQVEGTSGRLGGLGDALDEINGIIRLVGVLKANTNCLTVAERFSGSLVSWKTVRCWCWVGAGKIAKRLDGRVQPVCQNCVVHVL